MAMIVVPDDDLKNLERRLGPSVRLMGTWNTDGVFGYTAVSLRAIDRAADGVEDPQLSEALEELKRRPEPERTGRFIDILRVFGPALVLRIVAAYRESAPVRHRPAATLGPS